MADSTDPTTGEPAPAPARYVLTATIDANGALQLSGNLRDNSVAAPVGTQVVLKIDDPDGYHVYGVQICGGGDRAQCWGRPDGKGLTRRKFTVEAADINNITYAVSASNTADIKYGPVITVKPKG